MRVRRVEKDKEGGWIARRRDGSIITDEDWRWNSRSVARSVVTEEDWLDDARAFVRQPKGEQCPMTKQQVEDTIRAVCDSSGLSNTDLADVLDALKTGYQMLVEEGEP